MRIKLSGLVLLVVLVTATLVQAQGQAALSAATDPVPSGQIGGVTTAIAYSGGQLYFNVGPRLARLTVSAAAPLTPTLPGVYGGLLPGVPEDIKVANGFAYVALGEAGVAVVDIATLSTLTVQTLPLTGTATALAVGPQRLYVAAGLDGIIAYDLGADKKTLTYAQTLAFTTPVRRITDVEVREIGGGQFLFVSANNFAANPANRGGVLRFDITVTPILGIATDIKEQIDVNAIALTDAVLYAASDAGFYALDSADLGATGISSTLALPNRAVEVALRPDNAIAYLMTSSGGIEVIDISAPPPGALIRKTTIPFFTAGVVKDLAAAEFGGNPSTFLYLADLNAGLSIASAPHAVTPQNLTVDRPSYVKPQPAIVGVAGGAYPQAFAYSLPSTLWTINTANLDALSVVGNGLPSATTINALTTYSTSLLVSVDTGLDRYQINPGGEPGNLESFPIPGSGSAYAAAVTWPYAVVANGSAGLAVVAISDTMSLAGSAPQPVFNSDFRSVAVQGNYAYVGDEGGNPNDNAMGTFRIYDITDPEAPVARGVLSQTGILDVEVSGNFAFLAVGNLVLNTGTIRVVDISNPDAPILIGDDDLVTPAPAQSLARYQNYLFVAEGDAGVQIFAIQPTGLLDLMTTLPTSGAAMQVAWVPGQLYVADDYAGLVVFQIGADIDLAKTAPATAYASQNFTYTLDVTNVGVAAATGIVVTDVLPSNVSFVTAPNCANASGTVTCAVNSLAVGASATFTIVVKSDVAGVYTNTADSR